MKTILGVESHPNLGALYEEELGEDGYRLLCAGNGREAAHLMARTRLDLLVLEPLVPGPDEVERLMAGVPELPVIINSDYATFLLRLSVWRNAAFVSKSSDLSALKRQIEQALVSSNWA